MTFDYDYNFSNEFHTNSHFLDMCLNMKNIIKKRLIVDLFPKILYVTVNIIG